LVVVWGTPNFENHYMFDSCRFHIDGSISHEVIFIIKEIEYEKDY